MGPRCIRSSGTRCTTFDAHGIRSFAPYQARYGHLAVWPLGSMLDRLAGGQVDLAALCADWEQMLHAGEPSAR